MEINERINNIVTAFKKLNGYNTGHFKPLAHDLHNVYVSMGGQVVQVISVAFNDLINRNLSMTINHPNFNYFPVCLKLHINDEAGKVEWQSLRYKVGAKDALGDDITPEEVLDRIQEAVTIALSNFVRDICEDMRRMTKFSEEV
jgi:hypothetical protein